QAIEDSIQTVTKKRKINIPTGVKTALSNAKAQTTGSLTMRTKASNAEKVEENDQSAKSALRRSKSTSILEKASSRPKTAMNTYSRRRSSATLARKEDVNEEVKEEENGNDGTMSRRSSMKATANSVRKNVVRTVTRGGRGAAGGRTGKSIRVIEDA
ncbi:MAG: hypothetical protein Q9198_004510, partial [Flavoplaca austrocitrina]